MTQYNFTVDAGLTIQQGNLVVTTIANAGGINFLGNSSGDGNGYTTMQLVPDDTLTGTDQYLIIDPTAPGHVHIRAGGAQDNSSAQLFLGGENSYVQVPSGLNPNVLVSANTHVWTFGSTGLYGELTLPGEGLIRAIDDSISLVSLNTVSGNANSVYLGSSGGLGFNDQAIGGNWLEIFRNGTEPEIRVPVGLGNLNLQTAEGVNAYNWVLDNTGNLTVPGAIVPSSNAQYTLGTAAATFSDAHFSGTVNATDFRNTQGALTAGIDAIGINADPGKSVYLYADGANVGWNFDTTGNLTLPGNTFAVNYANGTPVNIGGGGGGTYGDANVTTLLAGNTVTTNINTTANVDAAAFNAVTSNVVVGTTQAVATKFGTAFSITSAAGATDGTNGVDINITAGDANESGGTPAEGGSITIQAGVGTTQVGKIRIGAEGNGEEIVMGSASGLIKINTNVETAGTINAFAFSNGADDVAILANAETWVFGATGNLTLPGNTFAVNYANGTPVTFGSASIDSITTGANIIPVATNTQFNVTALAQSATVDAPTGSPTDGAKLTIRIRDNGSAQNLTWNVIYQVIGTTLPTTTVANKYVYVGCIYNSQASTWDVVSVAQQA